MNILKLNLKKLWKYANKIIYTYIMSDLSSSISSESIQDGGVGNDMYMMIALGISCATISLTCVILICIINNKSNC